MKKTRLQGYGPPRPEGCLLLLYVHASQNQLHAGRLDTDPRRSRGRRMSTRPFLPENQALADLQGNFCAGRADNVRWVLDQGERDGGNAHHRGVLRSSMVPLNGVDHLAVSVDLVAWLDARHRDHRLLEPQVRVRRRAELKSRSRRTPPSRRGRARSGPPTAATRTRGCARGRRGAASSCRGEPEHGKNAERPLFRAR